MKLVVQVKLMPTREQAAALESTLRACNQAADWTSAQAFARETFGRNELQRLVYGELKARFSIGAGRCSRYRHSQ